MEVMEIAVRTKLNKDDRVWSYGFYYLLFIGIVGRTKLGNTLNTTASGLHLKSSWQILCLSNCELGVVLEDQGCGQLFLNLTITVTSTKFCNYCVINYNYIICFIRISSCSKFRSSNLPAVLKVRSIWAEVAFTLKDISL